MANMRANGIAPKKGMGNGTGRNKSRSKKRDYQAHCRSMRLSGMGVDPSGSWVPVKEPAILKMICAK